MERLFPQGIGQDATAVPPGLPVVPALAAFDRESRAIASEGDGYLQFVDGDALMALATQEDLVIRLERRPGHYVIAARPLARVWPAAKATEPLVERICAAFVLGNQRTSGQDIEFAVNQLVEIAIRALSPGINDPMTAIACVDRLGSALCRLAERDMPSPSRYDDRGHLRIVTPVFPFPDVTDAAFNQIRQYARSSTAVTIRLLEVIAEIAGSVHRPEDRIALLHHAGMIARGAHEGLPEREDRVAVEARFKVASRLLGGPAIDNA